MEPPRRQLDPGRVISTLVEHGVEFVVIGALAAIAQGYPLNTQDIDVTPARDPENVRRLADALTALAARLRTPREPDGVPFPLEPSFLGSVDSWTLRTDSGDLDLLFAPAGTRGYDDLKRGAVEAELWGSRVRLASLEDIIRMKEAAGRAKDLAQLPALRETLEIVRERRQS